MGAWGKEGWETYDEDDLGVGPEGVDPFYEHGVLRNIALARNVVRSIRIIGPDANNHDISSVLFGEVPYFRLVAVDYIGLLVSIRVSCRGGE